MSETTVTSSSRKDAVSMVTMVAAGTKPVPLRVTRVFPSMGPESGVTDVMVGGSATGK